MRASYRVSITPADNGIIVRVGCKLLVFDKENQPRFISALKLYLAGEEDKLHKEFFPEDFDQQPVTGQAPQPPPICEQDDNF